jgi:uncharacterized membrane protein YqjE
MESSPESSPGILQSLKRLLQGVLAIAANRTELLAVELREEIARCVVAFLLVAALVALGTLTLALITLTIVMVCGEQYRVPALVGLGAVYLLATVIIALKLRWHLQNWSSFSATVDELKKDKAWLEEKK